MICSFAGEVLPCSGSRITCKNFVSKEEEVRAAARAGRVIGFQVVQYRSSGSQNSHNCTSTPKTCPLSHLCTSSTYPKLLKHA
ncbi:hypothetical protein E2C01_040466 [Portunus trituberculatus]|uniref:Uncharacterized protein n=1 Tax=Portunus trituberculatus TaxID=210409 RepID=A0A5B7FHJ5_PORTR|nr:hypothetical protein [Portunus trituberculatus]